MDSSEGEDDSKFSSGHVAGVEPEFARSMNPPAKHYPLYFSFVYLGACFLFPYNAFVNAVDYFEFVFPNRNSEAVMVAVNFTGTILMIAASVVIVKLSDVHNRIRFGYGVFALSLGIMVVIVAILRGCGNDAMFAGLLISVVLTAVGAGVQQASLYGFASLLPIAYPQAVMTGESTAGSIVSTVRIVTKAIGSDALRTSTLIYFVVTMAALLAGVLVHTYVKRHPVVKQYLGQASHSIADAPNTSRSTAQERSGMCGVRYTQAPARSDDSSPAPSDIEMDAMNGAVLTKYSKISESPDLQGDHGNDAVPESTSDGNAVIGQSYISGDEGDDLIHGESIDLQPSIWGKSHLWRVAKDGLVTRLRIARKLWKWIVVISLTYFLTLLMFPALLIEVPWHDWDSWTPVILIAAFNYGDLIGKVVGPFFSKATVNMLLLATLVRFALFPILLLCILPCDSPYLDTEHVEVTIVVSLVLGISNGILGTLSMSQAPKTLPRKEQEIAGMLMILSCLVGLTIGAYMAVGIAGSLCNTPCVPAAANQTANGTTSTSTWYPVSQLNTGTAATRMLTGSSPASTAVVTTMTSPAQSICSETCLDSVIH